MSKLGLIILFVMLSLLGPFLAIWSLNTLFALGIPYSLKTWLAMIFLSMAFGNTKLTLGKK